MKDNLYLLVLELAQKMGKTPVQHRLFIHRLNEFWVVVINGCSIPKGFKDYKIDPGFCFVEYDDWPAGLFTPYGGQFVRNENASEEIFLGLLKEAIANPIPQKELK